MKSKLILTLTLVCLAFMPGIPAQAQSASEKVKTEISEALENWK
jgi:hypothetical protein